VLYLAPDPARPLIALTELLAARFPSFPPYAGRHAEVIPHLTVAQADESQIELASSELASILPAGGISSHCSEVVLMENSSGRWQDLCTFELGAT
jgi:hypothetical protein